MMVGEIVLDGWAVVRAICNSEEEAKARKVAID
jgi:hypothetical protein